MGYYKPPRHINLIWVGGHINQEYLLSVVYLAYIAKGSGFKLSLWVDKPSHFYKPFYTSKFESNTTLLKHINIRTVAELNGELSLSSGLTSKELSMYMEYTDKEAIGFHNQAARADIYRYAIMWLNGEYYLDIDFDHGYSLSNRRSIEIDLKYQKEPYEIDRRKFIDEYVRHKFAIRQYNNNFIVALPNQNVFICAIKHSLNVYRKYDTTFDFFDELAEYDSSDISINSAAKRNRNSKYPTTVYDRVRANVNTDIIMNIIHKDKKSSYKGRPIRNVQLGNRKDCVIECTGPEAIHNAIDNYCATHKIPTEEVYLLNMNGITRPSAFMGVYIYERFDNTWMKTTLGGRAKAFDDREIDKVKLRRHTHKRIMQHPECRDITGRAKKEDQAEQYMNTLMYSSYLHKVFQTAYKKGQQKNKEDNGYGEGAMVKYNPRRLVI
ncbi:MAG: hypothetical protein HON32_07640 [Francisellaceae bacterium]|nr:hypothetical protein [Francisellaceae bacterium]